jgi:hypothetical protein
VNQIAHGVDIALNQTTIQSLGVKSIPLDINDLEGLLSAGSNLGIVTEAVANQYAYGYSSLERAALESSAVAPTLRLEYISVLEGTPPGDYNSDGVVDAADYTTWRDGLGAHYEAADYGLWRRNYGGASTSQAGLNVPEPLTLSLAAIAFVDMWFASRSHRRHQ